MMKRIRRSTIARSLTSDMAMMRKMRNDIDLPTRRRSSKNKESKKKRKKKDRDASQSTAGTSSSSCDDTQQVIAQVTPKAIRWARIRAVAEANQEHDSSTKSGSDNLSNDATTSSASAQEIYFDPAQWLQERRNQKMKDLPSTAAFSSNHILVNRERLHRGKEPLIRCRHLDAIAKKRAQEMAASQQLKTVIHTPHMTENVQRGPSIRLIHQMIMGGVSDVERDNILDDRFHKFGMGTATGEDGLIYMSQIFQMHKSKRSFSM